MAIFPRAVLLFRFAVLVLLLFAGSAHGQWRDLDWLELMPEEEVRKMGWLLLNLRKLRK